MEKTKPLKIAYLTPSLHIAGGIERVLTMKASYLAEQFGYDVTIILTDGKDKPMAYPLSPEVKVVNLDIGFEELWSCGFAKKTLLYLKKQHRYRRSLETTLKEIRPDITVSLLRREINFICDIGDGSRKIGEMHINRANYRNFRPGQSNLLKRVFAHFWMRQLMGKLEKLDSFVVLTHEDALAWRPLNKVEVIPDPLSLPLGAVSPLTEKRVIAVGRYSWEKGFDLLLQAWAIVSKRHPDWQLQVFGAGEREPYEAMARQLGLNPESYRLNGPTDDIRSEYLHSSVFAFSSRFEGFGMALVEAMSCGLPVVSFACPCGPKEIISHQNDGLLVEPENIQSMADSICRIIEQPQLARQLAEAARRKAASYTIEPLALRWKELFERLCPRDTM